MSESTHESAPDASAKRPSGLLGSLDAWVMSSPFYPRILPLLVFMLMLMPIGVLYGWEPRTYPVLVALQSMAVGFVLWRYRRLVPEMTITFHWSAVVAGVLGVVVWIGLGLMMVELFPSAFESDPDVFTDDMPGAFGWTSLVYRFFAMSLFVPFLEEIFFRSAVLRSLQDVKTAKTGLIQFLEDLPGIGDWVMNTKASEAVIDVKEPLTRAFYATPVGRCTLFAVVANCVIWCGVHMPRDWPGTIGCGLLFIWVTWYTNRGDRKMGLGPVIWAHGITNALLVWYTVQTGDWQFL